MFNSLPQQFLNRLEELYPEHYASITKTITVKRPVTFRINTLLGTKEEVASRLKKLPISFHPVEWFEDAFITNLQDSKLLTSLPLYTEGKIYIQNLSSMIPPIAMDLKKGEKVLDLAAAPGSKTTEIASLLQNIGEIVANDKSHQRLFKLRAVVEQQGVTNVKITQKPGEIFWKWYPESFDKTLIDVPCSMEGRISTQDPESYKDWSLKKIKVLSALQKKLLRSAVSSTKVGGLIIYSTCTFSPEENEEVIDWILQKENGAVEVEPINIKGLELLPGLTNWGTKTYDPQIQKTGRVFPSETMEGFFIAKLRKKKSTVPSLL